MTKRVLSGNAAIARGAYEAGIGVVSSYPGTPSSEITDNIKYYDEIYSEWATNEKVAMEVTIGSSLTGTRSMTCMKHVGLNVASDPLMTLSYTGVNAGLVVVVADDPNMFSSQNEQDSRHYARFAKIPMLEPADSSEAKYFVQKAVEISEKYSTPVLLRSVTRLSHSMSVVELGTRKETERKELEVNIPKWVMVPANARKRHYWVEERLKKIQNDLNSGLNDLIHEEINSTDIGIVSSGIAYQYVKEALPEASVLKLDMVYPLALDEIKKFAGKVKKLFVVEELDPFIENELKAHGINVENLDRSLMGELSVERLNDIFSEKGYVSRNYKPLYKDINDKLPQRPPNMCPGCSHRGIFHAINKLKLFAAGDIGCYTLGLLPPLSAMHSTICMGASVSMAHGIDKGSNGEYARKSVAVIGDSTFLHTGINGLINSFYNSGTSTVIILDNRITGMTGHQPNPATGISIKGSPAPQVNIEVLCRGMGISHVKVVDPFNVEECLNILKEETAREELSVIITNRPCIFADKSVISSPYYVLEDKCTGCKACVRLGCPAILWDSEKRLAFIDETLCTGCGLCPKVCKFEAIKKRGE